MNEEELYRRHSAAFDKLHTSEKDDELVEKLARHAFLTLQADRDVANKWESESSETHRTWRIIARAALAAARPMIRAQALEEAAKVCEDNAAVLDHPSVYMGGPSNRAKMKVGFFAAAIRALRENSK